MYVRLPIAGLCLLVVAAGCHHHDHKHITAYPLSPHLQGSPEGIPYYLPKPLLVVAKNVRHIDESKVGMTTPAPIPNAFDDQGSYGSIKANVSVPGKGHAAAVDAGGSNLPTKFDPNRPQAVGIGERMTPPADATLSDAIAPDSFFTYQIVFVPDLSQKYVLQVKGGTGEVRAAMNLVNGWMYTGMGPYYMKDSSTAQNIMAKGVGAMFAGRAVADVVNEVGDIAKVSRQIAQQERAPADADTFIDKYTQLAKTLQSETLVPKKMMNYAEIYIYEPTLMPDGSMSWNLIAEHHFDRDYFQPTMNPAAMEVFQQIVKEDAKQAAAIERARAAAGATNRELIPPGQPAPKQPTPTPPPAARPPTGQLPGQQPLNPRDQMPSSRQPSQQQQQQQGMQIPPATGTPMIERAFDAKSREVLGLPATPSAAAAANQINVNVNPQAPKKESAGFPNLLRHFRKQPPKIETRVQRVFDDGSGFVTGSAGESVTTNQTIPGGR